MAKLDISERRLTQDGRIALGWARKRSGFPAYPPLSFREKTVMRILDKASLQVDLTKLGFEEEALQKFLECLNRGLTA